MGPIGPLVLLLFVGVVVYLVRRRPAGSSSAGPVPPAQAPSGPSAGPARPPLEDELAGWVSAGLISEEQSNGILAHTRALHPPPPPPPPLGAPEGAEREPRIPAVAEALGYLGATLAIVGLVLVVSRYWEDMALAGRLALAGVAAAVGLVGGFVVHEGEDPALSRLRWSLWLASTAAFSLFAGVAAADGLPTDAVESIVLAAAVAATVESGLLWFGRTRPVQQLVALAGLLVVVGAAMAEVTSGWPVGAVVWIAGAGMTAVGVRHLTTTPVVTLLVGGAGVLVGGVVFGADALGAGFLLLVSSGFALAAMALVPGWTRGRDDAAVLGAFGALALFEAVPSTLGYFSQEAGAVTGTATWLVGAALILAAHRTPIRLAGLVEVIGGLAMIGGAALTGVQLPWFAPLFGIATAAGFLVLGMAPERLRLSILGSLGLLVNVPWAIGRFFPGEGRVPLLIMVSGVLVIGLAVFVAHHGGRDGKIGTWPPTTTAI